ncbi:MAG: preprotein translocase subunit SecA, partial [Planctomycetota bacterium]
SVRLTQEGVAWIHQTQHELPIHLLHRTWSEYVQQALHARLLRRDVHYIVDDQGTVQIVDTSTGRIFTDRSWRDGLHQAVEAKERVVITGERRPLAQITRQRFARLYERLAGTTGTATGCEREFQQVYRLEVQSIPLRTPSQRAIWPARFFTRQQTKWDAIAASVDELHARQRPVLVGTRSIADSERLAELFRQQGIEFELLNGRQDAEEAAIVGQAGLRGAVTIATSLAGRGTDIKLGTGVADLGGLHVVVCECDESERIDRQLIGRCARQGEPGSAQIFVSAEDSLVAQHGSWLAQSIARLAGPDGELRLDLLPKIRRIQRAAERRANAARAALLRRDLSRDSLHSRRSLDS